jgi:hypothetical protein
METATARRNVRLIDELRWLVCIVGPVLRRGVRTAILCGRRGNVPTWRRFSAFRRLLKKSRFGGAVEPVGQ